MPLIVIAALLVRAQRDLVQAERQVRNGYLGNAGAQRDLRDALWAEYRRCRDGLRGPMTQPLSLSGPVA